MNNASKNLTDFRRPPKVVQRNYSSHVNEAGRYSIACGYFGLAFFAAVIFHAPNALGRDLGDVQQRNESMNPQPRIQHYMTAPSATKQKAQKKNGEKKGSKESGATCQGIWPFC
jgi:hypothetical protein